MHNVCNIEFDFFLPIGGACQTRHQIERYLLKQFNVKQPACFFDWLGLGGVAGVCKIIESDFVLNQDDFVVTSKFRDNNYTPIHLPSGFRFQHDFKANKYTRLTQEATMSSMIENMDFTLSKYQFLAKRTDGILKSAKTIGLIYHGRVNPKNINKLLEILADKYSAKFYFINVTNVGRELDIESEQFIPLTVDNSKVKDDPLEWQGDDNSWDIALGQLNFKPDFLKNFYPPKVQKPISLKVKIKKVIKRPWVKFSSVFKG